MRVVVAREPVAQILRWTQRALFAVAFLTLGYCVFVMADSWMFQRRAKLDLDRLLHQPKSQAAEVADSSGAAPAEPTPQVETGALIGSIDVDRLGVSVAVTEGTGTATLQRAAGHIAGTAFPGEAGNIGIAAHRDTFFRPLRNIRADDVIRVTTPRGEFRYSVVSTKIVSPDDVSVLESDGSEVLTLVTCYPFYFIGSAPSRFIVRAERRIDPLTGPDSAALQPGSGLPHLLGEADCSGTDTKSALLNHNICLNFQ